jgi:hypothetical protein
MISGSRSRRLGDSPSGGGRPGRTAPSPALAVGLFATLFSVYLLTFSGVYHSTDEMAILVTADSLARRGTWDIDLIRWTAEQQGDMGPDGHLYSNKGIGTSLAALPLYWLALQSQRVGNVQAGMLSNAVVTALTGVVIYLFLCRLRFSPGSASGTALAFGLGTMAWPYARLLFGESLAGLCLLLGAFALHRYHDGHHRASPLVAGMSLGIVVLTRLNLAVLLPFFALLLLVYLYRRHGRDYRAWIEPLMLFGLPILAALAIVGWYNWIRFGSPLISGYPPKERFTTPLFQGLYGLILSPGKGLIWYSPLLLAALAAWPAFFRRHRESGLLIAAVVLGCVAFYSPWRMWWAGHSWGPRFLLVVVPLASLPLASALEAAGKRRLHAVGLVVLAIVSVGVQVLGIAVNFNLYLDDVYAQIGLYHPATHFDPARSPLLRQFDYLSVQNLDLAWARGGSIDWPVLLTGVLLVLVSGLVLWAARREHRRASVGVVVLLLLVGAGTVFSLLRYAPTGNVAEAARTLARMERSHEAAAVTDPLLTEGFQDAYDGHLVVWGVPTPEELPGGNDAVWSIGTEAHESGGARFNVVDVRLDLYLPSGSRFEIDRLPVPPLAKGLNLGHSVKLVAVQLGDRRVRAGTGLPLTLYWRTLVAMETSYTVFVHVVNEEGDKIGQEDRLPCGSGCPTTTWRPGDLVALWYDVPIQAEAAPGRYEVVAGLYDLDTGERLPWLDDAGDILGDTLTLGTIEVTP